MEDDQQLNFDLAGGDVHHDRQDRQNRQNRQNRLENSEYMPIKVLNTFSRDWKIQARICQK